MQLNELIPVLQLSTGPVIVISGVGLVLLSMTNRYGRVIDRARALAHSYRNAEPEDREDCKSQLDILVKRARLMKRAITLASVTLLLAALLIINLFLIALFHWSLVYLIVFLFISCMASLISSLVLFLLDINMSLGALALEVDNVEELERQHL